MKTKNYKISCGIIYIRIDIDWPDADVDVSLANAVRMFPMKHSVKSKTPTDSSVDVLLYVLWNEFKSDPYNKNETKWQQRGITISETNGLMQGNSSIMFEIDLRKTSLEKLPELVTELKKVVSRFTSTIVKYYKPQTIVGGGIGFNI